MIARDIMSKPVVTVGESTPLPDVAKLMVEKDIGCVPVVDSQGVMTGMITESDFTGIGRCVPFSLRLAPVIFGARAATLAELEEIYAMAAKLTAKQAQGDRKLQSVTEETPVAEVVKKMLAQNLKHVPVLKDKKPVGMIARHDVLRLMAK